MLVLRWAILFLGLLNLGDVARADSKYIRHDAKNRQVIVFVHGVMGNSVDTWTNGETKVFWPNLISNDEAFTGANIFVVGRAQNQTDQRA